MFTGIIEAVGEIKQVMPLNDAKLGGGRGRGHTADRRVGEDGLIGR